MNEQILAFHGCFINLINTFNQMYIEKYTEMDYCSLAAYLALLTPETHSNDISTSEQIKDSIKSIILDNLRGEGLKIEDVYKLSRHQLFKEYYNGSLVCGPLLNAYSIILSLMREHQCLELSIEPSRWEISLKYIFALIKLSHPNCLPDWRLERFTQAVKYFEVLGHRFNITYDRLDFKNDNTRNSLKQIEDDIENRIKNCGMHFYAFILDKLIYSNHTFDRVFFTRRFESWRDKIKMPIEPLGIALKYAVKYKRKYSTRPSDNTLNSILELLRQYANLFQLYDFSEFDLAHQNQEHYIEEIIRNINFDQTYTLQQLPSKFINLLIQFIKLLELQNTKFEEEVILIEYLYSNYNNHGLHFPNFKIMGWSYQKTQMVINRLINQKVKGSCLSNYNNLNNSFDSVGVYAVLDYVKIKNQAKKLIFCNHPCLNIIVFEYLYSTASYLFKKEYSTANPNRNSDKAFGVKVGNALERSLINILVKNNIDFISQKKYNREDNPDLSLLKEVDGETDFIIESDTHILIIECKGKQLSLDARTGNGISVVLDIFSSLIGSQYQAKKAEYLIKKQGYIKFIDGITVQHKDRQIVTISLTLMENFQSIMDKHFARNIFEYFKIRAFDITILDEELERCFSNMNKKLSKLSKIDNYDVRNIYFLSLAQILQLLEISENKQAFINNLTFSKALMNGLKDWYIDLRQMLDMRKNNPNIKCI